MRKEKGKELHRRFPSFSIGTERTTFIDAPSAVGMVLWWSPRSESIDRRPIDAELRSKDSLRRASSPSGWFKPSCGVAREVEKGSRKKI